MTANTTEKPTFDFSEMSWAESKAISINQARIFRAQQVNDADALAEGFAAMQAILARTVINVPRAWLIRSAPEQIDWRDPVAFDLVRADRMMHLIRAMVEAQGEDSKN